MKIKDSGQRREFSTGAVRDINSDDKGRCDLLPLDVVAENMQDPVLQSINYFACTGDTVYLHQALDLFDYADKPTMYLELAKHFADGSKKYGEYNWQKGIPVHCYIDSGVRHYLKWLRGDTDEPHARAFVWNVVCCIWTCIHKPELCDLPRKEK